MMKRIPAVLRWRKRTGSGWSQYEVTRGMYVYILTEVDDNSNVWELWTALPGSEASDPQMIAEFRTAGRTPRVYGPIADAKRNASAYLEALDRRR